MKYIQLNLVELHQHGSILMNKLLNIQVVQFIVNIQQVFRKDTGISTLK